MVCPPWDLVNYMHSERLYETLARIKNLFLRKKNDSDIPRPEYFISDKGIIPTPLNQSDYSGPDEVFNDVSLKLMVHGPNALKNLFRR